MTENHSFPITPPPELLEQWIGEIWHEGTPVRVAQSDLHLAALAAQWGADQELEACCAFAEDQSWGLVNGPHVANVIRAARRPKPPSLKEEALEQLDGIRAVFRMSHGGELVCETIRRALESIPDHS